MVHAVFHGYEYSITFSPTGFHGDKIKVEHVIAPSATDALIVFKTNHPIAKVHGMEYIRQINRL